MENNDERFLAAPTSPPSALNEIVESERTLHEDDGINPWIVDTVNEGGGRDHPFCRMFVREPGTKLVLLDFVGHAAVVGADRESKRICEILQFVDGADEHNATNGFVVSPILQQKGSQPIADGEGCVLGGQLNDPESMVDAGGWGTQDQRSREAYPDRIR